MRSLWKCEKAVSTVFTAALISCACSLQLFAADAEEGEDEGELLGEELGDAEGDADAEADAVALADALAEADALADAEADGLAFTCVVIVMVATPFDTVAVTSAPVVPMRKIPAKTPDFAWKNSSRRRSSMGTPFRNARTSKPSPPLGGQAR
jgi:hypothetical protein